MAPVTGRSINRGSELPFGVGKIAYARREAEVATFQLPFAKPLAAKNRTMG